MGDIVNLRQVRKARDKVEKEASAAENRIRHGRSGASKAADRLAREKREALLDGARREEPGRPE